MKLMKVALKLNLQLKEARFLVIKKTNLMILAPKIKQKTSFPQN